MEKDSVENDLSAEQSTPDVDAPQTTRRGSSRKKNSTEKSASFAEPSTPTVEKNYRKRTSRKTARPRIPHKKIAVGEQVQGRDLVEGTSISHVSDTVNTTPIEAVVEAAAMLLPYASVAEAQSTIDIDAGSVDKDSPAAIDAVDPAKSLAEQTLWRYFSGEGISAPDPLLDVKESSPDFISLQAMETPVLESFPVAQVTPIAEDSVELDSASVVSTEPARQSTRRKREAAATPYSEPLTLMSQDTTEAMSLAPFAAIVMPMWGDAANDSTSAVAVTEASIPDDTAYAVPTGQDMVTTEDDLTSDVDEDMLLRRSHRGRRGGRSRKRHGKSIAAAVQSDVPPLEAVDPEIDIPDEIGDVDGDEEKPIRNAHRRMYISVLPSEQVEVAIVEDAVVQEYYLEMRHQVKMKGNIYKGIIHNIDANLQAAFVDYGGAKNGFLQIDEIHPEYFLAHHEPMKGKKYPPIQKVLRPGQEVLVQVVKEPNGSKGAFLTTWLSLAGRFLVLTPGQEQIGVSRKVESDEERSRLREMIGGINPGEGLGVIVRTVSAGTSKTTLKNDLQYLKRVWKDIRKRGTSDSAPALIYQEPGLAERAVRDYLTDDVCEIWVDNAEVADAIRETASLLFPRKADLVKVHADTRQGMWERFSLQRQLEQIYAREVTLPSGGRLVFDQTEALLAIDINSGKISGKTNFEAMAHRTNMEAAEAIARQLKLRDIGGQVVIDFIEMRDKNHVRDVEKTLRVAMKNDRARHDVSRMSNFGLLELVRQRTGSSALSITMEPCPHCEGTGLRRNLEWQALQALRDIHRMLAGARDDKCAYVASAEVGMYLLNHKRATLQLMEQNSGKSIEITIRP